MKFSKRIAYCGGLSALVFSLGAGAMQQELPSEKNEVCDNIGELPEYDQTAPIQKREMLNWDKPSTCEETCNIFLSIFTTGSEFETTRVRVEVRFHEQRNWESKEGLGETYLVEKVATLDEKGCEQSCQNGQTAQQLVVSLEQGDQFADKSEVKIINTLSRQAQVTEIFNVAYGDDVVIFEVDIEKKLLGYEKMRSFSGDAARHEWNKIVNHVNEKCDRGLDISAAKEYTTKSKHSKRRNKK